MLRKPKTPHETFSLPETMATTAGSIACFKGSREAALDRVTKSVDQNRLVERARELRNARFRWQRGAAKLLDHQHRVGLCRWAQIALNVGPTVSLTDYEGGTRASFGGVQLCGSVWVCPCCSARISEVRRAEMNALLAAGRAVQVIPVMVTLTARHGRQDVLKDLLEGMKLAKQRLHQRREWRKLKESLIGSVTATEVTHGRAGWHPHFHVLLLVRAASEAEAVALAEALCEPWLACLRGVGLDGLGVGFSAQGAAAAGDYVGKWGAAEEIALGDRKGGRHGGRSPMQLLADATDKDDRKAAGLWREFVAAFKGRRQLVWSRGLKEWAGIEDLSDEVAAEEPPEPRLVATIRPEEWRGGVNWRGARHRRGRLLIAAEDEGAPGVRRVVADGGTDPPRPEPPLDLIE